MKPILLLTLTLLLAACTTTETHQHSGNIEKIHSKNNMILFDIERQRYLVEEDSAIGKKYLSDLVPYRHHILQQHMVIHNKNTASDKIRIEYHLLFDKTQLPTETLNALRQYWQTIDQNEKYLRIRITAEGDSPRHFSGEPSGEWTIFDTPVPFTHYRNTSNVSPVGELLVIPLFPVITVGMMMGCIMKSPCN